MTDAQAQIREAIEPRIAAIRSKDAASAVFCVAEDVVALHHLTGKRVDRREVSLWMRSTLCFRREGGAWKIAMPPSIWTGASGLRSIWRHSGRGSMKGIQEFAERLDRALARRPRNDSLRPLGDKGELWKSVRSH